MPIIINGPNGRKLAFETLGSPTGVPIFLLHGTPGSLTGPRPREMFLGGVKVHLICYSRPGYPGSSRAPGRAVVDAADDVEAIADHLQIDRFSVIGRSGGAPHALACAAAKALHGRMICVAASGGLAPIDASPDFDWFDGMNDDNAAVYRMVSELDPTAAEANLRRLNREFEERARKLKMDFQHIISSLDRVMSEADRRVTEDDVPLRRIIAQVHTAALSESVDGWVDDVMALGRPWGFQPSAIKIPTLIWHGVDDTFSPIGHARWLRGVIPNAEPREVRNVGHFSALEAVQDIIVWVLRKHR